MQKTNQLKKGIAILGSTGSIGTQALRVIRNSPHLFSVELISGHSNVKLIVEQIAEYKPNYAVITDKDAYKIVLSATNETNTKVLYGEENLLQIIETPEIEVVLNALVGFSGLKPLIHTIKHKKQVLLANKESLVIAGEHIMALAKEYNSTIIPIDSEHSAIFQCLLGEKHESIEKVILTASGGPFLDYSQEQLKKISPADALKHPIWKMGKKVSIDSASLMNKGLEVIEAQWLFNLKPEQIDVIIHPQSVIHSLVQFTDGSLKAQISSPNMQLPIQYALHYPNRGKNALSQFSLTDNPELTFRQADRKKFRNLALAFVAMKQGGNMPAILNAANEVAVQSFLNGKWPFYRISELVEEMMNQQKFVSKPDLEAYFETTKKCFVESEAYIRKHT